MCFWKLKLYQLGRDTDTSSKSLSFGWLFAVSPSMRVALSRRATSPAQVPSTVCSPENRQAIRKGKDRKFQAAIFGVTLAVLVSGIDLWVIYWMILAAAAEVHKFYWQMQQRIVTTK